MRENSLSAYKNLLLFCSCNGFGASDTCAADLHPLLRNSDGCSYANSIFSDLTQYTNVRIRYKYDKNQRLLSVLFRILH